jgi:hypothetical protein
VFTPKFGFSYRSQELVSGLFSQKHFNPFLNNKLFNNTIGQLGQIYGKVGIEYSNKKFRIKIQIPASYQTLNLYDTNLGEYQNTNMITFYPKLTISYRHSSFLTSIVNFIVNQIYGDLNEVNYGYIMGNYRTVYQNATPISEMDILNSSFSIKYNNPINGIFGSISYMYSRKGSNILNQSFLINQGASYIQSLPIQNTLDRHSIRASAGRIFLRLRTTAKITVMFNNITGLSYLDKELLESNNALFVINPEVSTQIKNRLSIRYELNSNLNYNYVNKQFQDNYFQFKHYFTIFTFPFNGHQFTLNTEYYRIDKKDNYFVDLSYEAGFKKRRISFEARWLNILNATTYTTLQSSNYTFSQVSYKLRPMQVILSVKFSFL